MSFSEDESDRPHNVLNRRKRKRKRATLHSSEGEGDDLENSEAPSEDSDDGESLKNFLAEDEEEIATATLSSSQTLSSPVVQQTPRLFHKLSPLIATQNTTEDDDMPDVIDIIGRKMQPAAPVALEDRDTDDDDDPVAGHSRKRRRVLVDDSDE
jgi:ATP-dependent DNA helicase MPH1